MDFLATHLINFFEKPSLSSIFILIILFSFYTLHKLDNILNFIHRKKSIRLNDIQQSIEDYHPDSETKKFLAEHFETEKFYAQTGLRLEGKRREAFLRKYRETNNEIAFRHFKRAHSYFLYQNNTLSIKIPKIDLFFYWASIITAISLLCFIPVIIYAIAKVAHNTTGTLNILIIAISGLIAVIFIFFMAIFTFLQVAPVQSAIIIKKYDEEAD